jgi:hypothetical protein
MEAKIESEPPAPAQPEAPPLLVAPVVYPLEEEIVRISKRAGARQATAKALCKLYGPKPGCLCGIYGNCHAGKLWGDMAATVVLQLEAEGYLKL